MKKINKQYIPWNEIKLEICKEMGIKEKDFRDYHNIVGGSYKDLWYEWLALYDPEIRNDSGSGVELDETIEETVERSGKPWIKPFVEAVHKVWNKHSKDNYIEIWYSW